MYCNIVQDCPAYSEVLWVFW